MIKLFKRNKLKHKPLSKRDLQKEEQERKRIKEHQRAIEFIQRVRGEG